MSRKIITLEIDESDEALIRDQAAFLDEMRSLAAEAPEGNVLAVCEEAVVERGREHQRRVLRQAVQARIDGAEKKARR
jgi:hypothetical protein